MLLLLETFLCNGAHVGFLGVLRVLAEEQSIDSLVSMQEYSSVLELQNPENGPCILVGLQEHKVGLIL